jgi:phosphoglycerate dehydrogenase-like enzyme
MSGPVVVVDGLGTLALLDIAPLDPARRRRLERARAGLDVRRPARGAAVAPLLAEADAYVTDSGSVDGTLVDAAPRLRMLQICGALSDRIDASALSARGIAVSRLALPTSRAVAEHVLLMALACAHRVPLANAALHGWVEAPAKAETAVPYDGGCYNWLGLGGMRLLKGRRLGVLGLGDVGAEVARLARTFGMTVGYFRRNRLDPAFERRLGARYLPLDELIRSSDVLSVHLRRSPGTLGMVSRAVLERLPKGAIVVDTSRGGIVDHDALADLLESGHLGGAGLDVFPEEPMPASARLARVPSAILTPHCAGGSLDLFLDEAALVLGNVRRGLSGGAIRGRLGK